MSWDKGNGPWGGGDSQSPWGKNRKTNGTPPDFDELLKKGQDSLKNLFPESGKGTFGAMALVAVALVLWLSTGFYRVYEGEQAAILRFGRWVESIHPEPGLRYHWPAPIESVLKERVETINRIDSSALVSPNDKVLVSAERDQEEEHSMLTGDENIVVVNFTVFWTIKNLGQYLFKTKSPSIAVQASAESAVREIIGQVPLDKILTEGRSDISRRVQALLQTMMDDYQTGIQIREVQFKGEVPNPVIDSFRDVQRARADQERLVNEATEYANSVVPVARGEAEKLIQESQAYKQEIVAKAEGDVGRFKSILTQYKQAPAITRNRLYIETLEEVLKKNPKVIVDKSVSNAGVIPYLPLPGLASKAQGAKDKPTPDQSSTASQGSN